VGLATDAPVWHATLLSRDGDRPVDAAVTRGVLAWVLAQRRVAALT
jgi:hypothetical protein